MRRGDERRLRGVKTALSLWLVLATGVGLTAGTAQAADDHVLDPVLSLAGDTSVSTLDPVPDPGSAHPTRHLNDPCGIATDAYGNIYVANGAFGSQHESGGKVVYDGVIDVFDSGGQFITEIIDQRGPCSLAVDSTGRIYTFEAIGERVVRFAPTTYEPAAANIAYDPTPTVIDEANVKGLGNVRGLGFDPSESGPYMDRLYVVHGNLESKFRIESFLPDGSLAESFTEDAVADPWGLAVWGLNHDIFIAGDRWKPAYEPFEGLVAVLDGATHEPKLTLEDFDFDFGRGGVGIDQANGDIYVTDVVSHHWVKRFDSDGDEIGTLSLPGNGLKASEPFSAVAVDRGAHSPNQGYVYVTSGATGSNSHLYAFAPSSVQAPEVRGTQAKGIGRDEALLSAEVNPHGVATSYRFEYGAEDCATSACQSVPIPDGALAPDGSFKQVSSPVVGLEAGVRYHFRVVAISHCNGSEPSEECTVEGPDTTFTTFPSRPTQECANAAFRVKSSAGLPDCRAYELVTPPDTGSRIPTGVVFGSGLANSPAVLLARADGESLLWGTEGGTVPGSAGSGRYDTYASARTATGWSAKFSGVTGEQANESYPGGVSPDHRYSLWVVADENGSLERGQYLRGPDGGLETVGIGSLGEDPAAAGRWVSADATHLIFTSKVQLEPEAPGSGTGTVYDRSPGAPTHVVSLLPGNVTPAVSEGDAEFLGAAADGNAIAFGIGNAIYLRIENAETVKVADGPATFAGVSSDDSRVFYVQDGNIFAFEVASKTATPIGSGGESTLVNISADGSRAYFVSPVILSGAEANGQGEKALSGEENLYLWDGPGKSVRFVAIVEEEDVIGEPPPPGGVSGRVGGLGLWTSNVVAPRQARFIGPANDPSRTTADGTILVFESRAQLTDYRNEGRSEIYRYSSENGRLNCVSCNPTEASATGDARLESRYAPLLFSVPPVNAVSQIANIALGGDAVFFQSAERLAPEDTDGKLDVYEWKASGAECDREAGCLELISSGRSSGDDYLYGVTPDASSVFFFSGDTLVDADRDSTPSIYVARVGGGFAPPPAPPAPCVGDACQPVVTGPEDLSPASAGFVGPGNSVPHRKSCPAGKRKVRSGKKGKSRCLKRPPRHHRGNRKADTEGRAGR